MTKFILPREQLLNSGLLLAQDEEGKPIESLLYALFNNQIMPTTATTLELTDVLRWSIHHKVNVKTNVSILDHILKKIDNHDNERENLRIALSTLYSENPDTYVEMWTHKLEKDFHPGYWLIAAQCMSKELYKITHLLEPINKIKNMFEAYTRYHALDLLSQWQPSTEFWSLLETNVSNKIFKNLVGHAFYSVVNRKMYGVEKYAIGLACSKILSCLPESKTCLPIVKSLVKSYPTQFTKKHLAVDGMAAIDFILNDNQTWARKFIPAMLNKFLSLAIKTDSINTQKRNYINSILQKLLESDTVSFNDTTAWWEIQCELVSLTCDWYENIDPTRWRIPEHEKVRWLKKMLDPLLVTPNGVLLLDMFSVYNNKLPILTTTCFDLMSEEQWQHCTQEWSKGTLQSLRHQLKWLHVDHHRINDWKNSSIGKKTLCAALLHFLAEQTKLEYNKDDNNTVVSYYIECLNQVSELNKIKILPHPFTALSLWHPKYMDLYKTLSVELLTSNTKFYTDRLNKVISSFLSILLEKEINTSLLLSVRESIDPNMDFILLVPESKIKNDYDVEDKNQILNIEDLIK